MWTSDEDEEIVVQFVKRKADLAAQQPVRSKSKRRKESSAAGVNETVMDMMDAAILDLGLSSPNQPNFDHIPVEDIVRGGDMIVNVGKHEVTARYRVSSQFLWVTSSTFAAWFGPNAQFSRPRGSITLDDDPEALKLVFRILCYKHEELPETMDLDSLVGICRIADKYHLEGPLRLVVIPWIKELASHIKSYDDKAKFRDHRWLFVSWVFRCDDLFVEATRRLSTVSTEYLDDMPDVPEGLTDKLRDLRAYRIDKLRGYIIEQQNYRCRVQPGFEPCKADPSMRECHYLQRGFLEDTIEFHCFDDDDIWAEDVKYLCEELQSIDNYEFVQELEVNGQRYISSGASTRVDVHRELHKQCAWLPGWQELSFSVLREDLHLRLSDFPSRGKIENFYKILENTRRPPTYTRIA